MTVIIFHRQPQKPKPPLGRYGNTRSCLWPFSIFNTSEKDYIKSRGGNNNGCKNKKTVFFKEVKPVFEEPILCYTIDGVAKIQDRCSYCEEHLLVTKNTVLNVKKKNTPGIHDQIYIKDDLFFHINCYNKLKCEFCNIATLKYENRMYSKISNKKMKCLNDKCIVIHN